MPLDQSKTKAKLYRMVTDEHTCPYGLKSKDLLEHQGFDVEDHKLETREETDAFMEKHSVETTPQTFIEGERIGGYEALRVHFDLDKPEEERSDTTYQPVMDVFCSVYRGGDSIRGQIKTYKNKWLVPPLGTIFTSKK